MLFLKTAAKKFNVLRHIEVLKTGFELNRKRI